MYIAAVALCILYCLQGFESDCRPLMHMYTGQKVQSIDWVPDSSVNSEEGSVVLPQGACNRQERNNIALYIEVSYLKCTR